MILTQNVVLCFLLKFDVYCIIANAHVHVVTKTCFQCWQHDVMWPTDSQMLLLAPAACTWQCCAVFISNRNKPFDHTSYKDFYIFSSHFSWFIYINWTFTLCKWLVYFPEILQPNIQELNFKDSDTIYLQIHMPYIKLSTYVSFNVHGCRFRLLHFFNPVTGFFICLFLSTRRSVLSLYGSVPVNLVIQCRPLIVPFFSLYITNWSVICVTALRLMEEL